VKVEREEGSEVNVKDIREKEERLRAKLEKSIKEEMKGEAALLSDWEHLKSWTCYNVCEIRLLNNFYKWCLILITFRIYKVVYGCFSNKVLHLLYPGKHSFRGGLLESLCRSVSLWFVCMLQVCGASTFLSIIMEHYICT